MNVRQTDAARMRRSPLPAPESRGPSTLRLILALTIFITAVLGSVFFAVGRPSSRIPVKNQRSTAAKDNGATADAAFFYTSVGHAPAAFHRTTGEGSTLGKDSFTLEIQVASSREEAEHIIDGLHAQGVEAYYTPLARSGRLVYRIRQGLFANQKDADLAALDVQKRYALTAKVVKLQ